MTCESVDASVEARPTKQGNEMKTLAPLLVCIAATGCDNSNTENSGDARQPAGAIAAATPEPEGRPAAPAMSTQVLAAYEQVRVHLAADKGTEHGDRVGFPDHW
jgi:hypothetical protein